MTDIRNYQFEPFLTEYFLLTAVCKGFLNKEQRLENYNRLAEIFCISKCKELTDYFELSETEEFISINDKINYERFCRMMEFAETYGNNPEFTGEDAVVLSCKGSAVKAKTIIFDSVSKLTEDSISETLTEKAAKGNTDAMALLSYMEYNGICMSEDKQTAVKRLRLTSKWNSIFANLLGIAYDAENTENYYNNLYTIMNTEERKERFRTICAVKGYDGEFVIKPEVRIMEKAFGNGIIKRNLFEWAVKKIIYSPLISAEDKEKLFLGGSKEVPVLLSDIPFELENKKRCDICTDFAKAKEVALLRENEQRIILQSLKLAIESPEEVYRPLLVEASDTYICHMYADMIKNCLGGASFVDIDASTVNENDFSAGKDNVFLRGLSETKTANTIFFVHNAEALAGACAEKFVKFLDTDFRKHFRISSPSVTVDISGIMIIVLAADSTKETRNMADYCDNVKSEKVSIEEKKKVVKTLFRKTYENYRLEYSEPDEDICSCLLAFELDTIEQMVDGAVRKSLFDGSGKVKPEHIKKSTGDTCSKHGFGYFGGYDNA